MIQIDLLDENYVNALVPVFSMAPDEVIFFYDRRVYDERRLRFVKEAIWRRNSDTAVSFIHADKNSYGDIYYKMLDLMEQLQEESPEEDIYIEVTGGESLMAISGAELSNHFDATLIRANLKKGWIIDVVTEEQIVPVIPMTLDDFLAVNGAKRLKNSHVTPERADYERICNVAEFLFDHVSLWHMIHGYITSHLENKTSMSFMIPKELMGFSTEEVLKIFCENDFLVLDGTDTYRFADKQAKEYVTTYGVWLELYVYIKLSSLYDEVYLGLVIDWNNADEDTIDNEIDIVVMKYSTPIFISCKMTKPKPSDVYEVFGLAKRVDISAKGMLATTYSIDDDTINGVYQRAKKMKVGLMEVRQFQSRLPMEVFNNALQMTNA